MAKKLARKWRALWWIAGNMREAYCMADTEAIDVVQAIRAGGFKAVLQHMTQVGWLTVPEGK